MPRDALANPVALAALGALLELPMHPYQLADVLAGRGVPVNRGSLYDTVDAMTRAGWIVQRPTERAGARPQRTPYAVTGVGRSELVRRLDARIRTPRREFPEFLSAVSQLGVLGPERAADALSERAGRLAVLIADDRRRLDAALGRRERVSPARDRGGVRRGHDAGRAAVGARAGPRHRQRTARLAAPTTPGRGETPG